MDNRKYLNSDIWLNFFWFLLVFLHQSIGISYIGIGIEAMLIFFTFELANQLQTGFGNTFFVINTLIYESHNNIPLGSTYFIVNAYVFLANIRSDSGIVSTQNNFRKETYAVYVVIATVFRDWDILSHPEDGLFKIVFKVGLAIIAYAILSPKINSLYSRIRSS